MELQSAILQMFHGVRGQSEHVPASEKYWQLLNAVRKSDDALREKLKISPELIELYEKVIDDLSLMHCELLDNYYCEGFRFGILMGLDVSGHSKSSYIQNGDG